MNLPFLDYQVQGTIQNIQNLQMQLMQQEQMHQVQMMPHFPAPPMYDPRPRPQGVPIPQAPAAAQSAIIPIVIDSSQAVKLCMGAAMFQERSLMARNDIWHKIKIHGGGKHDKEIVLKRIMDAVYPADLIPVKYQIVEEDSFFIARNCDRALDQLCKSSLLVKFDEQKSLVLSVTLGFASIHDLKVNIQPLLLALLKKRCDPTKKTLVLDEFHKDDDIYKTVYCPLTQNRTFSHVLKLIKNNLPVVEHLSLKNNELNQLSMFETANIKPLKSLDLSHNELLAVESLSALKNLIIYELWLNGNPLCDNYSDATQYVESIRKYCPYIKKLDGVVISPPGYPLCFDVCIKKPKKTKLVLDFVKHFFQMYDCKDRSMMSDLYNDNSWYSVTVGTPTNPKSKKCLQAFGHENRNLVIFGKNSQQLYHGKKEIVDAQKRLPQSQHIHSSFQIDLMYQETIENQEILSISVEGLFKLVNQLKDTIFYFNRLFIIEELEDMEYQVINDQYHIYLPVRGLENVSTLNADLNANPPEFQPNSLSPSDKDSLIAILREASTMTIEYCEKYLTLANWDVRKAITEFMNHYKMGKIPDEAF